MAEPPLPSGTVTFLFTDIEGSTRLWDRDPVSMERALSRHDTLLRDAVTCNGGAVFKTIGDAFCAAFESAPAALIAALAAQVALARESWGALGPLRVRMAIHTGTANPHDGDYLGPSLNRIARLLGTGFGGQVLVSQATEHLVRQYLPPGASLRDLGKHRLRDLLEPEHVYQLLAPELQDGFPPLKSLERYQTNLPVSPNPLIGRESELAVVEILLKRDDVRLLTLTGVGGIGKTRLGLEVAAETLEQFEDGAFFVDLAPVADPALLLPTIAATLGIREGSGGSLHDGLVAHLAEKRLLLLLDNFEQVVEAAPVVAELLRACPGLKVLATSRTRLGLRAEHEHVVPVLAIPDPDHLPPLATLASLGAVALFLQRAAAIREDFELTEADAELVAGIVARLEGLPLAIELAAARVKVLAPKEILERLDSQLTLLTGGARDLPGRHQTLRAAIVWSHDALPAAQQTLFRRLVVFAGGFTLAAAEVVVPFAPDPGLDVLEGVTALLDQSLLKRAESHDGEARFNMLESLREFGFEQLANAGELKAARDAHADWCLELSERAQPNLMGPEQAVWLARLEDDHDNLRTALEVTEDDGSDRMLRIASSLWHFWEIRGHLSEGRRWLDRAIAPRPAPGTLTLAHALNGNGVLAYLQQDYSRALALYQESLAIRQRLDDRQGIAGSLNNLGLVADVQGEYSKAAALYADSLTIRRELGDRRGMAAALNNLGMLADGQGDFVRAAELYAESLEIDRELGDKLGIATSLNNLGIVASAQGDLARASELYIESLEMERELGDKAGMARSMSNLALVVQEQGDYSRAADLHAESLKIWKDFGDRFGYIASFEGVAILTVMQGKAVQAMPLLGAAAALREIMAIPPTALERVRHERCLAGAREQLGEPALTELLASGRTLTAEEAVERALGILAATRST